MGSFTYNEYKYGEICSVYTRSELILINQSFHEICTSGSLIRFSRTLTFTVCSLYARGNFTSSARICHHFTSSLTAELFYEGSH